MIVAAVTLITSRVQLQTGGPGVLLVTVPVPAFLLLAVAFVSARWARSFRFGLETGLLALAAGFVAVSSVVALEGLAWMDRHGVFMLDGDPPRHAVGDVDVMLDLFTTGMWLGHVIFWLPWPVIGAWMGRTGRNPPESTLQRGVVTRNVTLLGRAMRLALTVVFAVGSWEGHLCNHGGSTHCEGVC